MYWLRCCAGLILPILLSSSVFAQTAESQLYGDWSWGISFCVRFEANGGMIRYDRSRETRDDMHWRTLKELSSKEVEIEIRGQVDGDVIADMRVEFLDADMVRFTDSKTGFAMVFRRSEGARRK